MRGDIELMGVPPVPPTRENPAKKCFSFASSLKISSCIRHESVLQIDRFFPSSSADL